VELRSNESKCSNMGYVFTKNSVPDENEIGLFQDMDDYNDANKMFIEKIKLDDFVSKFYYNNDQYVQFACYSGSRTLLERAYNSVIGSTKGIFYTTVGPYNLPVTSLSETIRCKLFKDKYVSAIAKINAMTERQKYLKYS
jgi:hypothetical protein